MKTYLPSDTSLEALKVQTEVLRRRGPDWRMTQAFRMSNDMRSVAVEGVRARHPEYTARQVELAVARILLGDALFQEAYPQVDIQP
jgi:hypothetical protein